jgi:hypothetical protein
MNHQILANSDLEYCSICLEKSKDTTIKCNHSFCSSCIDKWFETQITCPLYRTIVKEVKVEKKSFSFQTYYSTEDDFDENGNRPYDFDENGNRPYYYTHSLSPITIGFGQVNFSRPSQTSFFELLRP